MNAYLEIPEFNKIFPYRSFMVFGEEDLATHWHKEIEIIQVLEGRQIIEVENETIALEQGDIYILNGGVKHSFLYSPNSLRLVIMFDLSLLHDVSGFVGGVDEIRRIVGKFYPNSSFWSHKIKKDIGDLLSEMHKQNCNREKAYLFEIKSLILRLVAIFINEESHHRETIEDYYYGPTNQNDATINLLDKIFKFVDHHYMYEFSLDEIAREVGLSKNYFSKIFKKYYGKTFHNFLLDYRIDKAKWLLVNEDWNITEVSEKVGFSSIKTFHRVFKESVGQSPLKFKKAKSSYKEEKSLVSTV